MEPDFLTIWRRYAHALKQRNALLKSRIHDNQLDLWDRELADAGEPLTRRRQIYIEALEPRLRAIAAELAPALGIARLEFQPGWARETLSLADALLVARDRDLANGYTSVGPHRADWRVDYSTLPGRETLSRGQAKLTALALLLAQAECHAAVRGEWPVVALDDLASELDRSHQRRVLARLVASGAQAFVTGTEPLPALAEVGGEVALFHVEQRRVEPAVAGFAGP